MAFSAPTFAKSIRASLSNRLTPDIRAIFEIGRCIPAPCAGFCFSAACYSLFPSYSVKNYIAPLEERRQRVSPPLPTPDSLLPAPPGGPDMFNENLGQPLPKDRVRDAL